MSKAYWFGSAIVAFLVVSNAESGAAPAPPAGAPRPAASAPGTAVGGRGRVGKAPRGMGISLSATGSLRVWRRGAGRPLTLELGVKPAPSARFQSRLVAVSQGGRRHQVLHVSVRGAKVTHEAAVWVQRRRLVAIWVGATGARNAYASWFAHLEIRAGGVRVYQRTRALQRCDGLPARMLSKGYHFASQRLLPILLRPPEPAGAIALTATLQAPSGARARPVAPFRFDSASSELGCAGKARRVSPPSELHDDRPATAWIEGRGGPGRWEFATAHATGRAYDVRAIRIQPGHATQTARFNRLKTLWVILGPKHRYRVTFPRDPAGSRSAAAGDPKAAARSWAWWVVLPKPVRSGCLTVVIEDVYPGTNGQTAISEVSVFTELDFGDPIARLLREVTAGTLERVTAVLYLKRIGRTDLPALRRLLPRAASSAEQEVIVRVLAELDPAGSAAVLARMVPKVTPATRRILLGALVRVGDAAVPSLASLLSARTAKAALTPVAQALARIGTSKAAQALVTRIGQGPVALRRGVVAGLAQMPMRYVRSEVTALLRRPELSAAAQADIARLLSAVVGRHPELRLDVSSLVLHAWPRLKKFEARYRFLELMGQLGDARFFPGLSALLRGRGDPILRERAVLALARSRHAGRPGATATALGDSHPRVRRGAALAWAATRHAPALATLQGLAERDPWPMVREAAIRTLSRACPKEGLPTLVRMATTRVSKRRRGLRRLALLGALRCRAPGAASLLGKILTSDKERVVMRRFAIRLLGVRRDARHLRYMIDFLDLLAKKVRRARSRNETLASDLAVALARIGDRRAVPALIRAAGVAHLVQLRAAALRALGRFCDPRARAVVQRALKSRHRLVLAAAETTQRRCRY